MTSLVHRGVIVFRLDELDVHVPGERHRQLDVSRGRLAAIALSRPREALEQKPRADPAVSYPPADRRVDVLDDIRHLDDLADALSKAKRGHVRLPALLTNPHELFFPSMSQPRLLVFVIAYYAEATLTAVLERIPRSIFRDYDCEVLVVDDASERSHGRDRPRVPQRAPGNPDDGAAQRVQPGLRRQPEGRLRLRHRARASTSSRWFTATGSTRRRSCRALVAPLRDGQADAVFGSRMMTRLRRAQGRHAALQVRRQPHPDLRSQNLLLGTQPHRVPQRLPRLLGGGAAEDPLPPELERVPLRHRDHHPAAERAASGSSSCRFPTYYGDEICRVNGMKYAKDVMLATLRNVAHRAGLLYQRRFEPVSEQDNAHYDLKLGYASSHQFALDAIAPGASVLDIGAGPGGIARELVKKGCQVAVVDQFPPTDAPIRVVGLHAGPRRGAGVRRPRLRLPAAARRDRAPEGPRAVPRAAARRSSTTRRGRWS